nr:hypothetical protein GCM10017745_21700 [Saccharothrix mutabilis subsp. capreolus]
MLGGAGLVLFGSVAVSGIKTLAADGLETPGKVLTVAIALGVGLVPIVAPDFYHGFPGLVQTVMDSGISAGTITAVVLNLLVGRRASGRAAGQGVQVG